MKKIICSLLLFLIFLSHPQPLLAQSDTELQLLQQSTVSAALPVENQAAVRTTTSRINAAAERLDKISQRISLRFQFLQKSKVKNISKLTLRYTNLTNNIAQLKLDLSRLEETTTGFLKSANDKDYPVYRNNIINLKEELKNILSLENSFITDMKQYALPAPTPTIIPTKTKTVSPTKTVTPTIILPTKGI